MCRVSFLFICKLHISRWYDVVYILDQLAIANFYIICVNSCVGRSTIKVLELFESVASQSRKIYVVSLLGASENARESAGRAQ